MHFEQSGQSISQSRLAYTSLLFAHEVSDVCPNLSCFGKKLRTNNVKHSIVFVGTVPGNPTVTRNHTPRWAPAIALDIAIAPDAFLRLDFGAKFPGWFKKKHISELMLTRVAVLPDRMPF